MERLILEDGGAVRPEDTAFCQRLQAALTDQNKTGSIITPKEWFPGWGTRKIGKLVVFDYFRQSYRVQRFVGFLTFEGRQVLIHSRFDRQGELFRYMMTRLGLMPRLAWEQTTDAQLSAFQLPLVYTFLRQLKQAYSIGVYRQYQTFSYNDSHPRGCINIPRHLLKNPIKNGRAAYSTREYTVDNPINRLILAAWQYISRDKSLGAIARQIIQARPDLYTPIKELNHQLGSPHLEDRQVSRILREAARSITHHMHQRYEQVRKTAILLLRHIGPEQAAEKSGHQISGMLFPMDIMWEFFLEETVLSFRGGDIRLTAQASIDILISPAGLPLRSIKPDFILYRDSPMNAEAVLDAKYKAIWAKAYQQLPAHPGTALTPEEEDEGDSPVYSEEKPWKDSRIREDSFQVMSYMHVTRANTGGILFPVASASRSLPVRSITLHSASEECILLIPVCLPTDTADFQTYCEEMDLRCNLLRAQLEARFPGQTVSHNTAPQIQRSAFL